jgi:ABC-type branched-subunit amino acid transport system substrate-binding protein
VVTIVLILSLTGPEKAVAEPAIQGATVAVEDINQQQRAGGRSAKLIVLDDGGDPATAKRLCSRFVTEGGVSAIVGSQSAAGRAACSHAAEQARIPYIALGGTEGSECYPNVYFTGLVPNQRLASLVTFLITKRSAKRFSVVSADTASGRAVAREAAAVISAAGGLTVSNAFMAAGATQLEPMLATVSAARPDVVLDALSGSDATLYHQQFGATAATKTIAQASLQLQEVQASVIKAGPSEHYLISDYLAIDSNTANKDWLSAMEKHYGDSAVSTALAAEAYDSVELVAAAVAKVKGAGGANVNAGLTAVSLNGPRGEMRIQRGDHGYATLQAHIGRLAKGGSIDQLEVSAPIQPSVSCA